MFYVINLGLDHMLLGMPFLAAMNPNINWTKGMFRGKVIASFVDAHKWIPNQDSRVYNPFRAIKTYHHFKQPEEGEIHMLNITPEDYDSQIDPTTSVTPLGLSCYHTPSYTYILSPCVPPDHSYWTMIALLDLCAI